MVDNSESDALSTFTYVITDKKIDNYTVKGNAQLAFDKEGLKRFYTVNHVSRDMEHPHLYNANTGSEHPITPGKFSKAEFVDDQSTRSDDYITCSEPIETDEPAVEWSTIIPIETKPAMLVDRYEPTKYKAGEMKITTQGGCIHYYQNSKPGSSGGGIFQNGYLIGLHGGIEANVN